MSKTETITTRSNMQLLVETKTENGQIEVNFKSPGGKNCLLHWGLRRPTDKEWLLPPQSSWPPGTQVFGQNAVQTPFVETPGHTGAVIRVSLPATFASLDFVLFFPDEKRWDNNEHRNYKIVLNPAATPVATSANALADEIIAAEQHNSWTLMHRFNLCHELLDQAQNNVDGLATLFVWLRFSAIRQLTWQRHYNTQPRELAHAQDRLTQKLAAMYRDEPAGRSLLRLMLTTVGRGGEGQRIRDEILNIMHRHHVKEVSGHFLEEWHQKLHNNTTPDDVVICEAFLEFLRTNGSRDRFYEVLLAGGVTPRAAGKFRAPHPQRAGFRAAPEGRIDP
jgi:alpha-glucan,water dikinase